MKKTARRFIVVIILIPIFLLVVNGYVVLYYETKTIYADKITLFPENTWESRNNKVLGESIDVVVQFKSKRIYNSEYYEGVIKVFDGKYNKTYEVRQQRFYPNSFFGKIYNAFLYIGTMSYDYNSYSFNIPDMIGGYIADISYSTTTGYTSMWIHKDIDNSFSIIYKTKDYSE